jgi:hypothetical protein
MAAFVATLARTRERATLAPLLAPLRTLGVPAISRSAALHRIAPLCRKLDLLRFASELARYSCPETRVRFPSPARVYDFGG